MTEQPEDFYRFLSAQKLPSASLPSIASIVGCAAWLVGGTCTIALWQQFFFFSRERFAIEFCADVCFTN